MRTFWPLPHQARLPLCVPRANLAPLCAQLSPRGAGSSGHGGHSAGAAVLRERAVAELPATNPPA